MFYLRDLDICLKFSFQISLLLFNATDPGPIYELEKDPNMNWENMHKLSVHIYVSVPPTSSKGKELLAKFNMCVCKKQKFVKRAFFSLDTAVTEDPPSNFNCFIKLFLEF